VVTRLRLLLPVATAVTFAAPLAAAHDSAPPLVATNGVAVHAACGRSDVRLRTGDGALLAVSVSRVQCNARAVAVSLLHAPAGAWLYLGTPDIYTIGRFDTACHDARLTTIFRLDPRSATASVELATNGVQRHVTLQPGQTLRGVPLVADGVLAWTIVPGGEAGSTTATVVEVVRPRCRLDVRALLVPLRTGG
jgi:hypothetical protein